MNLRRYAGVFRYAWLPLTQKNGLEHARHLAILFLLPKGTKRYSHSEQWFNFVNPKSQKVGWLTRYTLDRRPWHEMGFSAKNSMFFDVPHFALFQTTAKQHFIAFFPHCFKSCFSPSKKAMGVIGPRLCLKTHWFTIALTSSDIRVCPATLEVQDDIQ